MKVSTVFGIIGAIILILGIIFHLQGLSIVGPESSCMYSNPEWISYGIQILIIGIIVIGISIGIKVLKNY